jgi:hypothetical protein
MLMIPEGLRFEIGCDGNAWQKLKSADPTSRQRGHPTSTNPKLLKKIIERMGKISRGGPRWVLIPRRACRLTVGRNITLK